MCFVKISASTWHHRSVIGIKPIKPIIAKIKVVAVQSHGKNGVLIFIGKKLALHKHKFISLLADCQERMPKKSSVA